MQQLQGESKNVPTDVFLVCSSTSSELNREDTLSVQNGSAMNKLTCNNVEGNQSQHTGRLKVVVYVQSLEGLPLMPCSPAKAKKLLKSNKATVIKRIPFTVQLNWTCENQVQPIVLGIDSGYGNIGFSAITEKNELVSGTLKLDGRTSERLNNRKSYRMLKRNRLWYREPRFQNRTKKSGWLPPSIQRRYDTHLNLINKIKTLLPITKTIVEIGNFDIQKIENPEISGTEYQQGSMYEYQNTRSYLLAREKGLCQFCKKPFIKGQGSHVHHCKQRSEQGSNKPKNLAILHDKCHDKLHQKNMKLPSPKEYKDSTFMNIVKNRFKNDISDMEETYGYITFTKRLELGISKSHNNDAFVIAYGIDQKRCEILNIDQKHRHNRVIQINRKGFKPSIRKVRYKIQPKDLIWIERKIYKTSGIQNSGRYVKTYESNKIFSVNQIQKHYMFGSFIYEYFQKKIEK